MCKRMGILVVLFLAVWFEAGIVFSEDDKHPVFRNTEVRSIYISDSGMYAATKKELYIYGKEEGEWIPVFKLPASENEINCIWADAENILVGTKRGLLLSRNRGESWLTVFRSMVSEKSDILCIEASDNGGNDIFIGTRRGIFSGDNSLKRWKDVSASLRNKPVKCIKFIDGILYAGSEDGLYAARDPGRGWERRIAINGPENEIEADEPDAVIPEEDLSDLGINSVLKDGSGLYASSSKRIFRSVDGALSWQPISTDGVSGRINRVLALDAPGSLYCASSKGIFFTVMNDENSSARWSKIEDRIGRAVWVYDIRFDRQETNFLWAATNKGLYRILLNDRAGQTSVDVEKPAIRLRAIFDQEPTFKELQGAAMEFAEVDPDKITRWRNQAKLKALLPKVSLGFDKDRSSTAEIYTSATRDYVIAGPDDVSNGFDVSLSWELADLIWSDDQTNIDVRSRLTTQLRNDILDDLRRAYFERRRLQFELAQSPPKDLRTRFEKETRLQELTQAIDDLTGNYLSNHIARSPDM